MVKVLKTIVEDFHLRPLLPFSRKPGKPILLLIQVTETLHPDNFRREINGLAKAGKKD